MNPKLSVLLPCYHVPNLLENLLQVIEAVKDITDQYEIILIDDGNSSFPYISQNDYIKVITFPQNKGKGEALVAGFREARGEVVAFLDSDLQIPATLLKPYYEIITGPRSPKILIGSKRHKNSSVEYPFMRRVMSVTYQKMIKMMFGLEVLDSQVGLKMFKKEALEDIIPFLTVKRFAIDLEILVVAHRRGHTILEAPVTIHETFNSTVNAGAVRRMILDTFGIWWRKKFKRCYERRSKINGKK